MVTIFWGKVMHGEKRGRQLGFPTANILLHKKIEEGIYVSRVYSSWLMVNSNQHPQGESKTKRNSNTSGVREAKNVIPAETGIQKRHGSRIESGMTEGGWCPSVTFIGSPRTFNQHDYKAEAYLLDFSGNLYDKWITIKLLKKIRDNKKFDSVDDLVKQMTQDVLAARKFFG